jgi:aldehyde:ferredoxin oxidoreductase
LTGVEKSAQELLTAGRKIQNIERAFNLLHAGYSRQDDMPPQKLVSVPVSAGPYQGEKLDLEKWGKMLSEFYAHHHWTQKPAGQLKNVLKTLTWTLL